MTLSVASAPPRPRPRPLRRRPADNRRHARRRRRPRQLRRPPPRRRLLRPQPTTATMPDVTGQTEAAAATAMRPGRDPRQHRLRAGRRPARDGAPAGEAGGHDRALPLARADQRVEGAERDAPTSPSRTRSGRRCGEAVSTINGAHLRLIYVKFPVTSDSQAGKVVQQSPLGGGKAPQNAQIARLPRRTTEAVGGDEPGSARAGRFTPGAHQPRVSSSSLGSSDCVEMPTIASPRPAETRASTSASR